MAFVLFNIELYKLYFNSIINKNTFLINKL